jgi:outer membrane receptor protein involved in Fe transport
MVLGVAPLAALLIACAAPAQAEAPHAVNIPEGSLESALVTLAGQTRHQLLYTPELVRGRRAPALSGRFTTEEALQRLLGRGDIVVARAGPNVIVLKRRDATPISAPAAPVNGAAARPIGGDPGQATAAPTREPDDPEGPAAASHTVEEVRVTGSNIRGHSRGASPLVVMDARDIERTGRATVAEALQMLPQNFGGESTEGTVTTRADRTGTNAGYGTAVNLRGLGPDATLVLVDGRRMAGSGLRGDFADVSTIPNIALERVEVLLDGASAIYGSDAVGGVVNLILRRDYDGAEVRARAGLATRGAPAEAQLGVALGRVWAGGSLLIAYEGYRRTALEAADRRFTASSDLRSLGGSDRRETLSFPGNILRTDPVTLATAPFWGVPPGQSGMGLRPQDFQAGVINLQNQNLGVDILPDQRRHGLFVTARQELSDTLEVTADVRYGFRKARAETYGSTATLTVGRNNPFFVSPNGASSHQIQYAFVGELGNPVIRPSAEALAASLGGRLRLPRNWAAEAYGAFSQQIDESALSGLPNTLILNEALGNTPDNPATPFRAATDGFFNPFAGVPVHGQGLLAALGGGFSKTRLRNQVFTAAAQADGPVLRLPGGELRAAAGVQARRETYRRAGASLLATAAPLPQASLDVDRSVLAAFAELRAPLIGPENRRPAIEALEITAAIRGERYDDFGTTVNPKAGVLWTPLRGLTLRASYSESFRAPALQELHEPQLYNPIRFLQGSERLLTLALNGGNPDLEPERATSWTAGFDWRPEGIVGLRVSGDWFRIAFRDRVDRPVLLNRVGVLTDPRLSPFVQRISPRTNAADLELITRLLADPATTTALGVFPPTEYAAIVDIRTVNTSRLEVEGLDFQATYEAQAFGGRVAVGANAAWMLRYEQQLTPTDTPRDLAGIVGFPARLRARATFDWTRGSWGAGLTLNHQKGQRDLAGFRIDDNTTLDARLRFAGERGSALEGLSATLLVRNVFDSSPPFYDNPTGVGFDPATGDPIGRFVALQLIRSW